jgi:DNA-binding GntR family transcriptional regulator
MAGYPSLIRESKPKHRETVPPKRAGLTTNDLYDQLKSMAVLYKILPGERVNELELAEVFSVSRTPLREALNRLVAENLLTFVPNRGFFVRELNSQDVFDLYELRRVLEVSALELAFERANVKKVKALRKFWKDVIREAPNMPNDVLVTRDEEFHIRLAALSGNNEVVRSLYQINSRIHFVRWVDLEKRREIVFDEHLAILDALEKRDLGACQDRTRTHIARRMEEIVKVVEAGVVRLYAR